MPYITLKMTPYYKQMTLDDILNGINNIQPYLTPHGGGASTRTYHAKTVNPKLLEQTNIDAMIREFKAFNLEFADLFRDDMSEFYYSFKIPKRSGGWRQIDAPNDELMAALYKLKDILENKCGALYHTAAYAYVRGRSHFAALKRHQYNESKWMLKTDFSNFFGSTTPEFVERQLDQIFPFSEIMHHREGRKALLKSLSLCFLHGGLPQGTPVSPMLTNLVMIPIDYKLNNALRNFAPLKQSFVYTRYADDIAISSKYDFDWHKVMDFMNETIKAEGAPFVIKPEKTKYCSTAGANWNLGLMLNKDNKITVGHRVKRQFKAALANYTMDKKNKKPWKLEDVQILCGKMSYYRSIEPEYINHLLQHYSEKFGISIEDALKDDLRNL